MKKTITFENLKKLIKEESTPATFKDPKSGFEFESEELRNIVPIDDTDAWTALAGACTPMNVYAPNEDDVGGGVFTADYFKQQYATLFEMADLLDKSSNPTLKDCAKEIRSVVTPWADKLKAYMENEPKRQDALKQKRREEYLRLRDEFKDEEI